MRPVDPAVRIDRLTEYTDFAEAEAELSERMPRTVRGARDEAESPRAGGRIGPHPPPCAARPSSGATATGAARRSPPRRSARPPVPGIGRHVALG
ncbi:hypothetical protein ACH4E7_23675 [Kitasatospora sp. NPDC018058]|uniref:hypothetical protein n=1 Tax=Kitasatospora sp. NPDC018058 TaxID=3364025 RepID=UPI0037BF836D